MKVKRKIDVLEYADYYAHATHCGNCGRRVTAYVKKGESLNGQGIECEHGGCYVRFRAVDALLGA